MRAQLFMGATLAILLGGCDNSQPSQPTKSISVRSEQQNALHNLSEDNLKIALRRAIYDSGQKCNTVTTAGYVQEYGNLSMWTASCASDRSFAVFVGPDGSVQVRDCKETEQLKLPACTIREAEKKPAAG
ncbi:MAG TPA: hypothetical protein VF470_02225 [Sphingomicrobium sp.]|jgi:hypothetical protein